MGNHSIVLAQRACIEYYPPVLNQAMLLSSIGEVTVLDAITSADPAYVLTPSSVKRVRVPIAVQSGKLRSAVQRLNWTREYIVEFRKQLANRPAVAIAYEPEAASMLLSYRRGGRTLRIIHLHEIPLPKFYSRSLISSLAVRYMLRNLRRADIVVVPDPSRARLVRWVGRLRSLPHVVMNCPRLLEKLPDGLLMPFLSARYASQQKIVHYQGSVGPDHNLENIIASMRYWPTDSIFVIVGRSTREYTEQLQHLAVSEGVDNRVIQIGYVPYDQVLGYAIGATVGVTFLDQSKDIWKLSAGASNKRFEYMALGIPQVTNRSPDVERLFVDAGVARAFDCSDIPGIGRTLSDLLENESYCRRMSEKARRLHLERYNYEHQLQGVLALIGRHVTAIEASQLN